ncbi:lipoprotein signal peptidase [Flavisolibacter ginsenosidimutans]|uniref:Lipoprotein signal peptidase n=1 Tax=Flavisolibacter ginsenosidimutans TaxID=661481 RepID=A0A5B8UFX2_9BACT|nr:lipoprotein signal peptidase [Flavisolibacter ginsenosidimutans]QEC55388.1 lipoprotein signal peptidase [Flavisolibacter ginsenosidimutans]
MKLRSAISIIALVIVIDQALKFWIKTSFPYGHVMDMGGQRWAQFYFIENPGMAWGMELGGNWGKLILTLFRLAAVTFGSWYLVRIVKQGYSKGFIVCAALIYAGALGNLIDSMFYGMIFEESTYTHIAKAFPAGGGYGGFLHGKVVDMLYFPMIENAHFPDWLPILGGKEFTFFSPIFNIADASISVGVLTLLLFQKRFLHKREVEVNEDTAQPQISSEEAQQMI